MSGENRKNIKPNEDSWLKLTPTCLRREVKVNPEDTIPLIFNQKPEGSLVEPPIIFEGNRKLPKVSETKVSETRRRESVESISLLVPRYNNLAKKIISLIVPEDRKNANYFEVILIAITLAEEIKGTSLAPEEKKKMALQLISPVISLLAMMDRISPTCKEWFDKNTSSRDDFIDTTYHLMKSPLLSRNHNEHLVHCSIL